MNNTEKAKRYDSLQVAFKCAEERYQRQKEESGNRININEITGSYDIISAYNKGTIDAYKQILDDLARWTE